MQTIAQQDLFTDLSVQEAANVNGAGSNYYYYSPPSSSYGYSSPSYGYGGCGYSSGGYGGYYGGSSSSGGSMPSVNQTVNVNVQVKD